MVTGFVLGLIRIVLELEKVHLEGFLYQFATLNFLYFCILLFLVSIVIMVLVSLFTEKPSAEQLNGLTFSTTMATDKAASRASWNKLDVWLSVIVLIIVVSVFIYFSPLGVAK
jgi:SSS family solute:Na+ symporter